MDLEAALALAYAHLQRRERTEREMREHLLKRGADDRLANAVLLKLTEQGHLDDARFASLFAQDRRDLSGWGTRRIRRALLERGVAPEVVESALRDGDGARPATDVSQRAVARARELERALAVLRSRFPGLPDTARDRGRALGVLLRKGYDYELAVDALAEHLRQVGDAVAPPCPQY
jgi:regulatory protein